MVARQFSFHAVLVGEHSPDNHFTRIFADPLFRVRKVDVNVFEFQVVGPVQQSSVGTFEDVLKHCRDRAREMGEQFSGAAESAAFQIWCAEVAERAVLASPLSIRLSVEGGGSRAEISFVVQDIGPMGVGDCIAHFADVRIQHVAQAIGMRIVRD